MAGKSQSESLPAAVDSRQPCEDALIREYLDASVNAAMEEFDRVLRFGTEGVPGVPCGGAAMMVGSEDAGDYTPYMGISREWYGPK